jgi:hypothetical protein
MPKHAKRTRTPQRSKRQRWMDRTVVFIMDAGCTPVPAQLAINELFERPANAIERRYLEAK